MVARRRGGSGRRAVRRGPLVPRRGPGGRRAARRAARRASCRCAPTDGVALHVEVDERRGRRRRRDRRVLPRLALDMDTWHYQRRDLGDLGRAGVLGPARARPVRSRARRARDDRPARCATCARVIEATAPTGPLVLVGHSMGGMTIMALADQHPELFGDRVVGVALVSTSPGKLAEVGLGVPQRRSRAAQGGAAGARRRSTAGPDWSAAAARLGADLRVRADQALLVRDRRAAVAGPVRRRDARPDAARRHRRAVPAFDCPRQARGPRRARRHRDAGPRRRAGRDDPRRPQPRHGRASCPAPSW